MNEFGQLIRQKRLEKNFTLRRFAKQSGISPAFLSKVERGGCNPPSEKKIKVIASLLGLDSDWLLAVSGKLSSENISQNISKILESSTE